MFDKIFDTLQSNPAVAEFLGNHRWAADLFGELHREGWFVVEFAVVSALMYAGLQFLIKRDVIGVEPPIYDINSLLLRRFQDAIAAKAAENEPQQSYVRGIKSVLATSKELVDLDRAMLQAPPDPEMLALKRGPKEPADKSPKEAVDAPKATPQAEMRLDKPSVATTPAVEVTNADVELAISNLFAGRGFDGAISTAAAVGKRIVVNFGAFREELDLATDGKYKDIEDADLVRLVHRMFETPIQYQEADHIQTPKARISLSAHFVLYKSKIPSLETMDIRKWQMMNASIVTREELIKPKGGN